MIEFTYTEMALLLWAVIASAGWGKHYGNAKMMTVLLKRVLEDPATYVRMRDSWAVAKEAREVPRAQR